MADKKNIGVARSRSTPVGGRDDPVSATRGNPSDNGGATPGFARRTR